MVWNIFFIGGLWGYMSGRADRSWKVLSDGLYNTRVWTGEIPNALIIIHVELSLVMTNFFVDLMSYCL